MSNLLQRNEPNVTEGRHKYVGGSDTPVVLGISKFKTQFELASEKMGITKSDFKGNEYTQYGHAMEPQIREYINLTTDYDFVETSTVNEELGLRSNTDGVDYGAKTLLEIKTHGAVPTIDIYKVQMQLYMYQNDLDQGLLALYERDKNFNLEFESENLDMIMVYRDDEFIEKLLYEIELFWKRCDWLSNNRGASEWDYNNCLPENIIPGGNKPMANELQVKTIKFEPAVIEFNHEEIEKELNEMLKKYKGLTFTEKEAKECRNTLTELRKVKNSIEQYRIKTKKQLNEPIKPFEEICKSLYKKVDDVMDPLKEQADEFDEKQREEKRIKVGSIKEQVIEDLQMDEELAKDLIIEDRYLNKSTTLKSIEEDLHEQANQLITAAQNEQQNIDLIKAHVKIVNLENDVELLDSSYLNLAAHQPINEIKAVINKDAADLVIKRDKELDTKRLAGAKKMKEQFDQEREVLKDPEPVRHSVERFVEIYQVTGTELQLDALEEYMSSQSLSWSIVEQVENE